MEKFNIRDYLEVVRAQIAEQYGDFNHDGSTDDVWTEIKSNVFHLADQLKIARKLDKKGVEEVINVYNEEIKKLGGPTVTLEEIWPK